MTPQPPSFPLRRSQVISWCLYDFSNSSYSAVITGTIFGAYYTKVIVGNQGGLGDVWWGRASSISMLFVALTSPYLGGIADSGGYRKILWIGYTWMAILCVAAFTILQPGMVLSGFALATLANIGVEGGVVFYNAYLPEIAPLSMQGRVSGWGYAVGYAGSIVALLAALPFTEPFRASTIWLLVAAQFALCSLPAFLAMPLDRKRSLGLTAAARAGFETSRTLVARLWRRPNARRFLLAYLLYEDGNNTVIIFSSVFAATTLGFEARELVLLYLVVQASALLGAWVMARPTDTRGPKFVMMLALVLWCLVVTAAYFVASKAQFWGVAVVAGLGLGSLQAASRAFYARFIPPGEENQYFGAYALVGKSAAVIGPLLFGEISRAFGSQRPAILSVAALFLAGLAVLAGVKVEDA
ncbi:MAG: MFS transporter [Acidobacteria bacterium]|nr:MFS transporter [Acidobacteriota bacterium]